MNGDRAVGTAALPPVPLVPHQPRRTEKPVHPASVLVGPPRQPITKGKVGLGVGGIPGYIPRPQCSKLRPVTSLLGLVDQGLVVQIYRAAGCREKCGFLRLGSHHVLFQHSGQLFPTFLHLKTGRQSVAGHGNKFVGTFRYVDLQTQLLVVDVVPGLVILESRGLE